MLSVYDTKLSLFGLCLFVTCMAIPNKAARAAKKIHFSVFFFKFFLLFSGAVELSKSGLVVVGRQEGQKEQQPNSANEEGGRPNVNF